MSQGQMQHSEQPYRDEWCRSSAGVRSLKSIYDLGLQPWTWNVFESQGGWPWPFFTLPGLIPPGESHSVLATRLERDHSSREIQKLKGLRRAGGSEEHESNLSSFREYL